MYTGIKVVNFCEGDSSVETGKIKPHPRELDTSVLWTIEGKVSCLK